MSYEQSRTPEWPRFRAGLSTDPRWGGVALASTRIRGQRFGVWIPRSPGASLASQLRILHERLTAYMERRS